MALAILEHWFLVAPIDGNALWRRAGKTKVLESPAPAPRGAEDSDYPRPRQDLAGMESWGAAPPDLCDEHRLSLVLDSIGKGAFGDVDCVKGVLRTDVSWVRFEISRRSKTIAPFSPRERPEPLVVAMGRGFDRARLQAAFDACAAMA